MRLLRQPLLHFVLLGAALFVVDAVRSGRDDAPAGADADAADGHTIVVSPEIVEELAGAFRAEFGRDPEPHETDEQVRRWVTDEALRREAIALGLDQNDPIIRRRLVQNMRFLLEDAEPIAPPADADVDAWLRDNLPPPEARARMDYTQVFVDAQRHDDPGARATELRQALDAGADPLTLGDPFIRGRTYRAAGRAEVQRVFGDAAAEAVATAPQGQWTDPVQSAFGLHLFRVDARYVPPAEGTEAERNAAARAIERERSRTNETEAIERVVSRYTVVREPR